MLKDRNIGRELLRDRNSSGGVTTDIINEIISNPFSGMEQEQATDPFPQDLSAEREEPSVPAQQINEQTQIPTNQNERFPAQENRSSELLVDRLRAFKERRQGKKPSNQFTTASSKVSAGGAKRYQSRTYEDAQGNIKLGVFDTKTGTLAKTDDLAGLSPFIGKDPRIDELVSLSKNRRGKGAQRVGLEGWDPQRFTVRQSDELGKFGDKFLKDRIVDGSRVAINASSNAFRLLEQENAIADEAIKFIFPRMVGEVGNLTQSEKDAFGGSRAIGARVNAALQRWREGTLTDPDRFLLFRLAEEMEKSARSNLNAQARIKSKALSKRGLGISQEEALEQLEGLANSEFDVNESAIYQELKKADKLGTTREKLREKMNSKKPTKNSKKPTKNAESSIEEGTIKTAPNGSKWPDGSKWKRMGKKNIRVNEDGTVYKGK